MIGHAVFSRDWSKTLINRIGVFNSYNAVKKDRDLLITVEATGEDSMPIPSTFTKTDFTIGRMKNLNYADRSCVVILNLFLSHLMRL